jgi:uncharacterized protein (TIGR03437 family)
LQVPAEIRSGAVEFRVQTGLGTTLILLANVLRAAPGLFTANGDGMGVVAATAIRISDGLAAEPVAVFQCGEAAGSCVSIPIELRANAPVYVSFFCTGIHEIEESNVAVWVAGNSVPVLYAGPQPEYDGLDQINVLVPMALSGSGEVDVVIRANGVLSNTGRINVL